MLRNIFIIVLIIWPFWEYEALNLDYPDVSFLKWQLKCLAFVASLSVSLMRVHYPKLYKAYLPLNTFTASNGILSEG